MFLIIKMSGGYSPFVIHNKSILSALNHKGQEIYGRLKPSDRDCPVYSKKQAIAACILASDEPCRIITKGFNMKQPSWEMRPRLLHKIREQIDSHEVESLWSGAEEE